MMMDTFCVGASQQMIIVSLVEIMVIKVSPDLEQSKICLPGDHS